MPKIIDTFIFYNELDMLEFRLTELDPVVDTFVLVEATKTFAGKPKPLHFKENMDRYNKWKDKIVHVIVDTMPGGNNAWSREAYQRNSIAKGVQSMNLEDTDIILIADCDEVPDVDILSGLKTKGLKGAWKLHMDFYYYNLMCKAKISHSRARLMDYKTFKTRTPEKHVNTFYPRMNCGWHFSYFGSEDFIINKIQEFSHQEFNKPEYKNKEVISQRIKNGNDLFNRDSGVIGAGPHKFTYQTFDPNGYLPKNWQMLLKIQNVPEDHKQT